ncbi:hypothetical protein VTN49DRAFT_7213 [Thermomyces lanuginosus]|uniref:uncharacterized protein n=1 Tax=Thermomyces lanuginosus TaxID=5541 RepID=UPI003743D127
MTRFDPTLRDRSSISCKENPSAPGQKGKRDLGRFDSIATARIILRSRDKKVIPLCFTKYYFSSCCFLLSIFSAMAGWARNVTGHWTMGN